MWDSDRLGRRLGYLPQDIGLLPATVAENIARLDRFASPAHIHAAAQAAGSAGGPIRGIAIVIKTQGDPLSLAEPLRELMVEAAERLAVATDVRIHGRTPQAPDGPRVIDLDRYRG